MECTKVIMHKKSDFVTFFQTLAQWVAIVALGVPPSGANPASMLELVEPLVTARTMSGTTKNKSFFEEEEEHNNPLFYFSQKLDNNESKEILCCPVRIIKAFENSQFQFVLSLNDNVLCTI